MSARGSTLFILVTCSLDPTRAGVLKEVLANLQSCVGLRPSLAEDTLVFDNASTVPGTVEVLRTVFPRVWRADRNVGYWTAVDWALRNRGLVGPRTQHEFVYVIESDMVHYAIERLVDAERFLADRQDIGAVRCQEYSVAQRDLYDKGSPVPGSRDWAWQSHVHRFTGKPIEHRASGMPGIYETDFLTQLPALNRMAVVERAFSSLRTMDGFTEPDFQRLCYEQHPVNALLDGGIYHCRLGARNSGTITGSWSDALTLRVSGYQGTRMGRIEAPGSYDVLET